MIKKIFTFISMLAVLLLVACSSEEKAETVQSNEDDVLTVFTTIYPLQYFTERIGGTM